MEINTSQPLIIQFKKSKLEILGEIIRFLIRTSIIGLIILMIIGVFALDKMVTTEFEIKQVDWYGNEKLDTSIETKNELDEKIILIPINGMITNQNLPATDSVNSEIVLKMLDMAENDPAVKAVILKIDSPGGTVLDSEKIAEKIVKLKNTKKVYALLESLAASGGYYIASQADKIFAYKETLTGSIGVIMEIPNVKKLTDKIGVDMIAITSGNMKTMGSPFSTFTDESKVLFQALVDESYLSFVDRVAQGRNLPIEEVKKLADGRIYSGKQAYDLKLIDALGGIEALKTELADNNLDKANLFEFYVPLSPLSEIMAPMNKVFKSWFLTSDTKIGLYYKVY